jgi:hypothetical protein
MPDPQIMLVPTPALHRFLHKFHLEIAAHDAPEEDSEAPRL